MASCWLVDVIADTKESAMKVGSGEAAVTIYILQTSFQESLLMQEKILSSIRNKTCFYTVYELF